MYMCWEGRRWGAVVLLLERITFKLLNEENTLYHFYNHIEEKYVGRRLKYTNISKGARYQKDVVY